MRYFIAPLRNPAGFLEKRGQINLAARLLLGDHPLFCSAGDHTIDAIHRAVQSVTTVDADDYFVVIQPAQVWH